MNVSGYDDIFGRLWKEKSNGRLKKKYVSFKINSRIIEYLTLKPFSDHWQIKNIMKVYSYKNLFECLWYTKI